MVALFLEETEAVVARMAKGSSGRVAHDLHLLKGLALNLGLNVLARQCQAVERQVTAGQSADLSAVVTCFRASAKQFRSGLAANAA